MTMLTRRQTREVCGQISAYLRGLAHSPDIDLPENFIPALKQIEFGAFAPARNQPITDKDGITYVPCADEPAAARP